MHPKVNHFLLPPLRAKHRLAWCRPCHNLAVAHYQQARGDAAEGVELGFGVEHYQIGGVADGEAVGFVGGTEGLGWVFRNHVPDLRNFSGAAHLAVVNPHEGDLHGVADAERVPWIHNGVVADADVDSCGQQFFYARVTTTFWIGIEAALEDGIVAWVGDHVEAGAFDEADELEGIRVVHAVHGGRVAGGDASAQAAFDCLSGQHFGETRIRVIGLIYMEIERLVELLGEVTGEFHIGHTVVARHFVVRDSAHKVATEFHRSFHQHFPVGERVDAVLWERDELEIDKTREFLLHFQQCFHGGEFGVADINVTADARHAMSEFPFHGERGTAFYIIECERLFPFRPNLDAFNERARLIETRLPNGQHSVEMHMDVCEGRRYQFAGAIDDLARTRRDLRSDFCDDTIIDGDIDVLVLSAYASVAKNQVHNKCAVVGVAAPVPGALTFAEAARDGGYYIGIVTGEFASGSLFCLAIWNASGFSTCTGKPNGA